MKKTYSEVKKLMLDKGYKFFEGEMSINLIGVRKDDHISNQFDDKLLVCIVVDGSPKIYELDNFTTEPGHYYAKEGMLNKVGTAILKPGQYLQMWQIGLHRGKYEALVQRGICTVYRDSNKDECIDVNVEDKGYFGINLHHAYGRESVGKYSAGCQVFSSPIQLFGVIDLCRKSAKKYGGGFTYTLLEENDFK